MAKKGFSQATPNVTPAQIEQAVMLKQAHDSLNNELA